MCRFIAYIGKPLLVDDVLYKPKNSLIHQSAHAKEMAEPLNGDGFGMGWYAQEVDDIPGLFKSIQPAWNDVNLQYLAKKIRSSCFCAHIRAASQGSVARANSHPFHYKQFLFMHNGNIGGFQHYKRHLRRHLSDEVYEWIKGQTDSEHLFALFINNFNKSQLHFNATNAVKVLEKTIRELKDIRKQANTKEPAFLNLVITNGKSLIAVRYVSDDKLTPRTLYYAAGREYEYHDGVTHMQKAKIGENKAVLVVSEKLTMFETEWHEVPTNHIVMVHEDLDIEMKAFSA